MAQQPRIPNIEAQRAAMKKLEFTVGKWAGEARLLRESGDPVLLIQTEEAQYKLDGLVLLIEGVGRTKADGKRLFRRLGSSPTTTRAAPTECALLTMVVFWRPS
jgi:hypothetical protein